jgi:hypothetical protein
MNSPLHQAQPPFPGLSFTRDGPVHPFGEGAIMTPGQSLETIDTVKQEKSTVIPAGKPESSVQGWHSSNPAEPK